jgi:hypothetical protein
MMRYQILSSIGLRRIVALCTVGTIAVAVATFGYARGASASHQHDFDFEFGSWKATLRMQPQPLTASADWVTYTGTSIVHKLLNGQANVGELEVSSGSKRIDALTIRMYDSRTQTWSIYFANVHSGLAATPTVGRFDSGRGVFYDTEQVNGKATRVRFVFEDITATSFRFVQSFSADGGKSWVPNWIATFTR